eukprot:TRINITY_DN105828_c0_g1_i1.p1 TRINITY_DN105828_c0_g1~~TRINITY_DN105828_c0_g1_i1.p1  ORF type:complete len:935 (-),score=133.36 TRINITY_DN105828_c0_g1_i1:87-2867(-)
MAMLTVGSCFVQAALNGLNASSVICPLQCPYASICPDGSAVQCVRAADCRFWDKRRSAVNGTDGSFFCRDCRVLGCEVCDGQNYCSRCSKGLVLQNGKCTSDPIAWYVILGSVCAVSFLFVIDMFVAYCRPCTNDDAMRHGLQHRSRCHLRDHTKEGHPVHSFFGADLHSKSLGGPGLPLFFNWFILVGILSLWLAAVALGFGYESLSMDRWTTPHADLCVYLTPKQGYYDRAGATADWPGLEFYTEATLPYEVHQDSVRAWTIVSYVGAIVISGAFLVWQHRLWCRLYGQEEGDESFQPLMQHYAFEARGFPADATDHKELRRFWANVIEDLKLGLEEDFSLDSDSDAVADISIAYSYSRVSDEITALIDGHLQETRAARHPRQTMPVVPTEASVTEPQQLTDGGASEHAGTPFVQLLAWFMLGADMHFCGCRIPGLGNPVLEKPAERHAEILDQLEASGSMVVVLQKAELRKRLLDKCQGQVPLRFRNDGTADDAGYPIFIQDVCEEPVGVFWENFGEPRITYVKRFAICLFAVVAMVAVWNFLFYIWVSFSFWSLGDDSSFSSLGMQVVALFAVLGNLILGAAVAKLSSYYGFHYKRSHLIAYLTTMVLFNSQMVNNSEYVVIIAQSMVKVSTDLSLQFLMDYGIRISASDLFFMLVPMYCIFPYLAEPFFTILVPYWVGIMRVKGDRRIGQELAGRLLEAGEMDVVNTPYNDLICITGSFIIVFFAPAGMHCPLFLMLALFAVLTYVIARKRVLAWETATYLGNRTLHDLMSYLWAWPLALLAANVGSRVSPLDSRLMPAIYGVGFFCGHVLLHCLFVALVVPCTGQRCKLPGLRYQEALKLTQGATYRNTNPVEVLKSVKTDGNQLTFYCRGKEFLQMEQDLYYEGARGGVYSWSDFKDEYLPSCCRRRTAKVKASDDDEQ